jgi:transposase
MIFDNHIQGFESLRQLAHDLCAQHNLCNIVYGVEPTASYHKPLAEYLIGRQDKVVYVSNVAVKKNRALLDGRWDKNDKKDAANIADLIGQGRCQFYDLATGKLRELRSLLAYRAKLKKQEHALRMRLRNTLLAQYFPELERHMPQGGQDDLVMNIVAQGFDPKRIAEMSFEFFLLRVTSRKMRIEQERRLRAIWMAAKESAGCPVPEAAIWEGRTLVEQLRKVRDIKHDLEHQLKNVCRNFAAYQCLLSIPGFGPIVSAMVLAAIGDPHRFTSRKQVLRLAGLDLSASRSGKQSNSAVPVISKQGKAALRYALVQAALVSSYSHPCIRSYFTQLLKGRELERGIKMKMKIKLAAKLLVVAWTLMKNNSKFNPVCFKP